MSEDKKYKFDKDSMPVKGVIRYDAPDGQFVETGFVMPYPVMSEILMHILNWEELREANVAMTMEYMDRLKEYMEKNPYNYVVSKKDKYVATEEKD